jgi:hypothetical protein
LCVWLKTCKSRSSAIAAAAPCNRLPALLNRLVDLGTSTPKGNVNEDVESSITLMRSGLKLPITSALWVKPKFIQGQCPQSECWSVGCWHGTQLRPSKLSLFHTPWDFDSTFRKDELRGRSMGRPIRLRHRAPARYGRVSTRNEITVFEGKGSLATVTPVIAMRGRGESKRRHRFIANGKSGTVSGFDVAGVCWPFVSSFTRSDKYSSSMLMVTFPLPL